MYAPEWRYPDHWQLRNAARVGIHVVAYTVGANYVHHLRRNSSRGGEMARPPRALDAPGRL
eukprot:gene5556-biopygen6896